MSNMYSQFGTDPSIEKNGIILNYGDFRITIARSGGANKKYQKSLERVSRPYQRALQSGLMENDRAMELLKIAHAEAIVRNWEVKDPESGEDEDKWVQGIEGPEGDILPFNRENVLKAFRALDDLFQDVREQAASAALFRTTLDEELGKN